jgi:polyisoprenoid-binding protein YceI
MKYFILFSAFLSITAEAVPTVSLDTSKSSVEFLAIGRPSALKIRGTKGKPEGKVTFNTNAMEGTIILNLESFETGMSLRDRHMKEKYLETGKEDFKNARVTLSKFDLPKDYWINPTQFKAGFVGKLLLHGIEKEISGEIEISSASKESIQGQAKFSIMLTDFGIAIPSFSGITVAEKVDIEINYFGTIESL